MTTNTITPADIKPAAHSLPIDQYTDLLATSIRGAEARFDQADLIVSAVADGYTLDEVAYSLSVSLATQTFPAMTPKQVEKVASTPRSAGGTLYTKQALSIYTIAWNLLESAGVEAYPTTYDLAFRLAARGGSAPYREVLVAKVAKLPEAKRVEALVKGVGDALLELKHTKVAATKAPKVPVTPEVEVLDADEQEQATVGKSAKDRSETVLADGVPNISAEQVVAVLRGIATQPWDDADRKRIIAALEEATADMSAVLATA